MRKKILLDTNLLLLFVVGLTNESYVERHEGLTAYDRDDYLIIKRLVAESAGIVVTPHVLTETSNLLRQIKNPMRKELTVRFGRLISNLEEAMIGAQIAVARSEYPWLGLPDAAILATEMERLIILTADAELHHNALAAGRASLNYNNIRDTRPDYQLSDI